MPVTKKDLPDLASINPHDPGNWATWAYVLITEWLNYYKRVTFLSVHMPGHCRELGSFPELMPLTKKDLPDLASINPHGSGNWAIWIYVLITEWLKLL